MPAGIRLRVIDLPHWRAIIATKPRVFWEGHMLPLAAQLARTLAHIERVHRLVDHDDIATIHATAGALGKLTDRMATLRRMLALNPHADGERRDRRRRQRIVNTIERGVALRDDLLN